MNNLFTDSAVRFLSVAVFAALFAAGCGGGSSNGGDAGTTAVTATTGTVGLLFTDKPTDEFSAIKLNVVEAILIGGDGQQTLFTGSKAIDLLNLTNYNEPVVFGEVAAGNYTKLRLRIDNLELVPLDGSPSIFPALPANGKIDLLDQDGFDVLPGRTMLVEIDMDANKSIKITGAGNGKKYNFRPVVKVDIMDAGLPDKLARLEGVVSEIPADPAGSLVVCSAPGSDNCINVFTGADTSVFDDQGLGADFSAVMVDAPIVVIGRYVVDPDVALDAIILELGGNAEQLSGNVVSEPMDSEFLLVVNGNGDVVVELQPGTRYFDAAGEIASDAIVLGADLEIEGVMPAKADPLDPDRIRAALVFVEAEDDELLSGTIIEPLDAAMRSFGLTATAGGDTCVRVNEDADILLVDEAASEVTMGSFDDLAVGQMVDLFGITAVDSCFEANEVIVEVVTP